MNEELAALERALRRAAKERAEREAALETLRTDLEDSMVAHGEAEARLETERATRQDTTRRLLTEQARHRRNLAPPHCPSGHEPPYVTAVTHELLAKQARHTAMRSKQPSTIVHTIRWSWLYPA